MKRLLLAHEPQLLPRGIRQKFRAAQTGFSSARVDAFEQTRIDRDERGHGPRSGRFARPAAFGGMPALAHGAAQGAHRFRRDIARQPIQCRKIILINLAFVLLHHFHYI